MAMTGLSMHKLAKLNVKSKWAILGLTVAIVLGLSYVSVISDSLLRIDDLIAKEEPLKKDFEAKLQKAKSLDLYKRQLADIEQRFSTSLRQLPSKTEMEGLLNDINQAGIGRGLSFELFKPSVTENMTEVYAELPVSIKVTGSYADFGLFAADVAKLPRIVTLNDVNIKHLPAGLNKTESTNKLSMELTAKVYRYLDDKERYQQVKQAQNTTKKQRKAAPKEGDDSKEVKK
jgi:type IV pilus assembly protein PilO